MSFFKNLFARPAAAPQNGTVNLPGLSMADVMQLVSSGGITSDTGVVVTRESAMRLPAVYSCISLLSSTLALLPFDVFERTEKGSVLAEKHPLYRMLHDEPNPMMTSFIWRELSVCHLLTQGNGISVIARDNKYDPIGLYPVDPDQVDIVRKDGKKYFRIQTSRGTEVWDDKDVIHVPGLGFDGIRGLSPIMNFAREALGQAQATQKHTANFFKNGANLGATLQTDSDIALERQQEILGEFKKNFSGVENARKVALLVSGLKYTPVTVNNADAQLIETMKLQVADIARIFRVPPHMIGDLDKATFSNIEQQSINYVQYSILPWAKRIEQEVNRKLFRDGRYFARFNLNGLMRGDFATRMEGYSKGLNAGMFTINEVREIEGFNQIDGGDVLRVPLNMAALTKDGFTAIDAGLTSKKT